MELLVSVGSMIFFFLLTMKHYSTVLLNCVCSHHRCWIVDSTALYLMCIVSFCFKDILMSLQCVCLHRIKLNLIIYIYHVPLICQVCILPHFGKYIFKILTCLLVSHSTSVNFFQSRVESCHPVFQFLKLYNFMFLI